MTRGALMRMFCCKNRETKGKKNDQKKHEAFIFHGRSLQMIILFFNERACLVDESQQSH
jgi:hypothetical protein